MALQTHTQKNTGTGGIKNENVSNAKMVMQHLDDGGNLRWSGLLSEGDAPPSQPYLAVVTESENVMINVPTTEYGNYTGTLEVQAGSFQSGAITVHDVGNNKKGLIMYSDVNLTSVTEGFYLHLDNGGQSIISAGIGNPSNQNHLEFYTGNNIRMTITETGSIGIGSSPTDAIALELFDNPLVLRLRHGGVGTKDVSLSQIIFTPTSVAATSGSLGFPNLTNNNFVIYNNKTSGTIKFQTTSGIVDVINTDGSLNIGGSGLPTSTLQVNGSIQVANTSVNNAASPFSTTDSNNILSCLTSTGAVTITLATATVINGRTYHIKDTDGNASVNNITINTQGAETIDGVASTTISSNYGVISLYSNGTHWFTL